MKVGYKARRGRHRRSPQPHADHRKRPRYERVARIRKKLAALASAPTVRDFELEHLSPMASGVHVLRPDADTGQIRVLATGLDWLGEAMGE